jgi:heme exporter protein D
MFSLATQASVVLWVYIVQTVIFTVFIFVAPIPWVLRWQLLIIVLFLMVVSAFLTVYGVHCMVVGKCNVYAWVIAGLILLSFVVSLVDLVVTSAKVQKEVLENYEELQKQQEQQPTEEEDNLPVFESKAFPPPPPPPENVSA